MARGSDSRSDCDSAVAAGASVPVGDKPGLRGDYACLPQRYAAFQPEKAKIADRLHKTAFIAGLFMLVASAVAGFSLGLFYASENVDAQDSELTIYPIISGTRIDLSLGNTSTVVPIFYAKRVPSDLDVNCGGATGEYVALWGYDYPSSDARYDFTVNYCIVNSNYRVGDDIESDSHLLQTLRRFIDMDGLEITNKNFTFTPFRHYARVSATIENLNVRVITSDSRAVHTGCVISYSYLISNDALSYSLRCSTRVPSGSLFRVATGSEGAYYNDDSVSAFFYNDEAPLNSGCLFIHNNVCASGFTDDEMTYASTFDGSSLIDEFDCDDVMEISGDILYSFYENDCTQTKWNALLDVHRTWCTYEGVQAIPSGTVYDGGTGDILVTGTILNFVNAACRVVMNSCENWDGGFTIIVNRLGRNMCAQEVFNRLFTENAEWCYSTGNLNAPASFGETIVQAAWILTRANSACAFIVAGCSTFTGGFSLVTERLYLGGCTEHWWNLYVGQNPSWCGTDGLYQAADGRQILGQLVQAASILVSLNSACAFVASASNQGLDDDSTCPDFDGNEICDDLDGIVERIENLTVDELSPSDLALLETWSLTIEQGTFSLQEVCDLGYIDCAIADLVENLDTSSKYPCANDYRGTYDSWFASVLNEGLTFSTTNFATAIFGYDSSAESFISLATGTSTLSDGLAGVNWNVGVSNAGQGLGTCLIDMMFVDENLSNGNGWDVIFSIRAREGSGTGENEKRTLPLFLNQNLQFGMCFLSAAGTCLSSSYAVATCIVSSITDTRVGIYPYLYYNCGAELTDFSWNLYLDDFDSTWASGWRDDLLRLKIFNASQAVGVEFDHTIDDSLDRFWDCFTAEGDGGGYDFEGQNLYSEIGYLNNEEGQPWWRTIPFVSTGTNALLDFVKGFPCGMHRLFIPGDDAIIGITRGAQNCETSEDGLICSENNFLAKHYGVWSEAVNGTIECRGVALGYLDHSAFDAAYQGSEPFENFRPFNVCDEGDDSSFIYRAGLALRPFISAGVIALLAFASWVIIRRFVETL